MTNHQNLKNAITSLKYSNSIVQQSEGWSEEKKAQIESHFLNLEKLIRESAIVPSENKLITIN